MHGFTRVESQLPRTLLGSVRAFFRALNASPIAKTRIFIKNVNQLVVSFYENVLFRLPHAQMNIVEMF